MVVAGPQDLVDQIAVAGHENQPLGIFIQTADGENPLTVADKALNVVFLRTVGGTDHAHRLVERNKDQIFLIPRLHHLAVHLHGVAGHDLITHLRPLPVDEDITLLNVTISIAPGTHPAFADVLVQTGGCPGDHKALPKTDGEITYGMHNATRASSHRDAVRATAGHQPDFLRRKG